jgi:hypothetical protein
MSEKWILVAIRRQQLRNLDGVLSPTFPAPAPHENELGSVGRVYQLGRARWRSPATFAGALEFPINIREQATPVATPTELVQTPEWTRAS